MSITIANKRSEHPCTQRHVLRSMAGAALLGAVVFGSASADDTEVFFGQVDANSDTRPNVLFVLDTSGSMNETDTDENGNTVAGTRLERMQQAMRTILDSSTNINVGVMRFNGRQFENQNEGGGGSVIFPMSPIDGLSCEGQACAPTHLELQLTSGENDSEEKLSNGAVDIDGNILSMGHSGSNAQAVGYRFPRLAIPQGATITSASLEFVARNDSPQTASVLTIGAQKSDDAPKFAETAENLFERPLFSGAVTWSPGFWQEGERYETEDIASEIQKVVNRTGWCGGNAIALVVKGSGQRDAKSVESAEAGEAPLLRVSYRPTPNATGSGCISRTLAHAVESSSDDAEMRWDNGQMLVNGTSLDVPYESNKDQMVGIRFTGIELPPQAAITKAYIDFTVNRQGSGSSEVNIYPEASGNPVAYRSSQYNLYERRNNRFSRGYHNPLHWSDTSNPEAGSTIRTPDMTSLVQTLVNRNDWAAGNAMAFALLRAGNSGSRHYISWDQDPSRAPVLTIEFDKSEAGDAVTVRRRLEETIDNIRAIGSTPIVDSYYEAAQYFRGGPVGFGLTRGPSGATHGSHRVSHTGSYTGGGGVSTPPDCSADDYSNDNCKGENVRGAPQYISPLASSCQTNHIVFLSDGEASANTSASDVRTLTGDASCKDTPIADDACGAELAEWLHETDHNGVLSGKQNISTYTIGFNLDNEKTGLLRSIASAGKGKYYPARSASDLTRAFRSIIGNVVAEDTSFVAPGATVNQFNRLEHRDDIYFAQFKPSDQHTWAGNVKRYQVSTSEQTGKLLFLDSDGDPAVDENTGFFATTARSFWLDADAPADGNQVAEGGAANKMDLTNIPGVGNRRVYTYLGDTDTIGTTGVDLTADEHALDESNAALTDALLGIVGKRNTTTAQSEYRDNLLKWARGVDVLDENSNQTTTDARHHMGDPMHSRPVIVNYATTGDDKSTLFVGTNEGYLHAVDTETGHEQYAFVPGELLPNLGTFYENDIGDRPYGLDGPITLWTDDPNDNLRVDTGEKAMLFIGMRRGGSNYYAIDISDRLAPRLAWVIKGGTGEFSELGQSWSTATPTTIRFKGTTRDVLIFGAGYDTNQDPADGSLNLVHGVDGVGRGVFIVDMHTGKRLWSAQKSGGSQQFTDLHYSIPSGIRVVDIDFDGFADQLYVGDTGGQLWRFDIKPDHKKGALLAGGVIARFNGLAEKDFRRFYYEPSVALVADDGNRFLAISVGSGWRAHPLDKTIDDRFYMVRSNEVYGAPEHYGIPDTLIDGTYRPLTESDLVDVTDNINAAANDYGWFLKLGAEGEKVLGHAVTFENKVLFSSYRPALNVDACTTAIGSGAAYSLNVLSGGPSDDLDGDGDIDADDREEDLQHGGIPPNPNILIVDGEGKAGFGAEPAQTDFGNQTHRTFWVDQRDAGTEITEAADE